MTTTEAAVREFIEQGKIAVNSMMNALLEYLKQRGVTLPSDELTVVDVGAREMPYGLGLKQWAQQQAKVVRVFAVDGVYGSLWPNGYPNFLIPDGFRNHVDVQAITGIMQVNAAVGFYADKDYNASDKLKKLGVRKIDLITLFNPNLAWLPDLRGLEELCSRTPVVGAHTDLTNGDGSINEGSKLRFTNELSEMGYEVVAFMPNPVPQFWRVFISNYVSYAYDPLFVALPK